GLPRHRRRGARGRQGRADRDRGRAGAAQARSPGRDREGGGGMSTLEDTRQGGNGYVGQAIRRKEDPPLITGRGRYVDDIQLPGTLHAAIVRSPVAHARINSIDASEAEARDDVHLVLTGEDLKDLAAPLPMAWAPPGVEVKTPEHWPLARGKVCHVGDPVAVVVADTKYGAADAADQIYVDYE